jgi:hypothetical protein
MRQIVTAMTITPEYRNLLVAERKLIEVIAATSLAREAAAAAASLCKVIDCKKELRLYYHSNRAPRTQAIIQAPIELIEDSKESLSPDLVPTPPTPKPLAGGGDLDTNPPH